jgi:hypothetical protein
MKVGDKECPSEAGGPPVLMVVSMPRAAQAMPYMLASEKLT